MVQKQLVGREREREGGREEERERGEKGREKETESEKEREGEERRRFQFAYLRVSIYQPPSKHHLLVKTSRPGQRKREKRGGGRETISVECTNTLISYRNIHVIT